jgi:voltage-gated potassium channel
MSTQIDIKRQASINYGLEKLNLQMENSQKSSESGIYTSDEMPGLEILDKFSSFKHNSFHFKWATLLFLCNIYNYFTVGYFLGFPGFPTGIWFSLELGCEVIFLIDSCIRFFMRNSSTYKQMWFIHEENTYKSFFAILLSSIPYSFILLGYADFHVKHWGIGLVRLPKLLRGGQFSTYLTNMKIVRRKKGWLFQEFLKILLIILGATHYAAMIVLFVERIEKDKGELNHYDREWTPRNATESQIFMDIEFYALGSLGGITISPLAPLTYIQKMISVFYRATGTSIIGAIFVKLVEVLSSQNRKKIESKLKLETAKTWVEMRKLSEDLKLRVLNYYNFAHEKFSNVIEYDFLEELPLSLRTEISLYLHKDLIPKVKLFELGDPAFMMGVVRHLKPKLYMAEDFIIRKGDYAEEFYFIRVGSVEVLATDNFTPICILEEGAYFGEIGILLDLCRTVSVRATIATLISSIHRENLLEILQNFPEHLEYLKKVAAQRLKTTNVEEFNAEFDLLEEYSDCESISSGESEIEYYAPAEHKNKNWIELIITVQDSKAIPGNYQIDPFSYFFYFWSGMLIASYGFYMYYVPLCICFGTQGNWVFFLFDLLAYFVFFVDIWISLNSSIITEFGNYIHDDGEIRNIYFNKFLLLDLISVIPSDYFSKVFGLSTTIINLSKIVRFCKYRRMLQILKLIRTKAEYSLSLIRILSYVPVVFYLTHLEACIFFLVCKLQFQYYEYIDTSTPCYFSTLNKDQNFDFLSLPVTTQYISFYYFTASISSSNVYNILFPVTIAEQLFGCFLIITSRLVLTFILAESSSLVAIFQKPYTDHMTKFKIIKEWMHQYKFPKSLESRVSSYLNLSWVKLKGVDDEEILKELPESMQTDISYFLYSNLIKSGFFPNDEQGAIRSILKKCRVIMHCAGEEIIKEGELGLEMYFVVEGQVEILTNKLVLDVLSEGQVFGEMALLTPYPTVRGATARAKTNVSVAMLSMSDFNFVMQIYPEFAQKVRAQASQREEMNRKFMHNHNVEAIRKHKRFSRIVRNLDIVESELFLSEQLDKFSAEEERFNLPVKLGNLRLFIRIYRLKVIEVLHGMVLYLNIVFLPLNLAFRYKGVALAGVEILTFLVYFGYSMYNLVIFVILQQCSEDIKKNYFSNVSSVEVVIKAVHHFVLLIPLTYALQGYSDEKGILLLCLIIRISNYPYLISQWSWLKSKLVFYNLIRMAEVIFHFFMISHILACMYLEIGKWDSPNWIDKYFEKFPLREDKNSSFSLYIIATHWAFTCLSNAALGDTISYTNYEKIYNAFTCTLGFFLYAMLFGNVCSLVADFTSKLRSKLFESYTFVIDFIQKKRVDVAFKRQVNEYFNYLWQSNKGTIEKEILKQLPFTIMCDVQMYIFKDTISRSLIFKDADGAVNPKITRTLFRLMELQYYLIGDTIVKIGDKKFDLFIIIQGEAELINLKGDNVVETLKQGDHFGEGNVLLGTPVRTYNVIASKISRIGAVRKEKFEKMVTAYPEWCEYLTKIAGERMNKLFQTENFSEASRKIEIINRKLIADPQAPKKYTKRAEKLIVPKLIETVHQTNNQKQWFKLSLLHLILLIYSIFAIPIHIAFDYPVTGYLLYVESFIILESVVFFLITCRFSLMIQGKKHEVVYKEAVRFFYQSYIIHDFIAISPFNLILPASGVDKPEYFVIILRMIRLFAIFRIPSLLQKIEIYSRSVMVSLLMPLRSVFFLLILLHWSSCTWFFIVNHERTNFTWIDYHNIRPDTQASNKWVESIYYVLNVVTGIGYGDTFPVDVTENILTLMMLIFGNIIFAVAFSLVASLTSILQSKVISMLLELSKIFETLKKSEIPENLLSRLEAYYVFNNSVVDIFGHLDCKSLYSHLPKNIVNKITYECNKHILKKMPMFRDTEFVEMVERISLHMIPKIYLPDDYIIYKNDVGEEMYFIILGSVNVLSPDSNKVIKTLVKGDYVGEVALLFDAKRICSVIAKTLSLLYMLGKQQFRDIIQDYPKAVEMMTEESNKRKKEASFFTENNRQNTLAQVITEENDTKNEDIVKTLNLYSAISNPFFEGKQISEKNMTAISGMSNFKSEVIRDSYYTGPKKAILYKRRPHVNEPNVRRFSQESLGKEIVLSNFSKVKLQWIVEDNSS